MAEKNRDEEVVEIKEVPIADIKKMNIYEKMSAIQQEIVNVNKNLFVKMGNGQYKAVGEGDVLSAVKPAEAKYRIYSYPLTRDAVDIGVIESYDRNGIVKKQQNLLLKTTYRFVNLDNTAEFIDMDSYGDGVDSGDKAPGKAMTYADKYALLKAYKIITGDDPDQEGSEPLASKTTTRTAKPATTAKKGVSEQVLNDLKAVGSSLDKVAAALKKNVEDLTDKDVIPLIVRMKKVLASKKDGNVQPESKPEEVTDGE